MLPGNVNMPRWLKFIEFGALNLSLQGIGIGINILDQKTPGDSYYQQR